MFQKVPFKSKNFEKFRNFPFFKLKERISLTFKYLFNYIFVLFSLSLFLYLVKMLWCYLKLQVTSFSLASQSFTNVTYTSLLFIKATFGSCLSLYCPSMTSVSSPLLHLLCKHYRNHHYPPHHQNIAFITTLFHLSLIIVHFQGIWLHFAIFHL